GGARSRAPAAGRAGAGPRAVIVVQPGPLGEPARRLLATVARRGHEVYEWPVAVPTAPSPVTVAVSDGPFVLDLAAVLGSLGDRPLRILVLSRLGAHPHARAASLPRLWPPREPPPRRGGGPRSRCVSRRWCRPIRRCGGSSARGPRSRGAGASS